MGPGKEYREFGSNRLPIYEGFFFFQLIIIFFKFCSSSRVVHCIKEWYVGQCNEINFKYYNNHHYPLDLNSFMWFLWYHITQVTYEEELSKPEDVVKGSRGPMSFILKFQSSLNGDCTRAENAAVS